MSKDDEKPVPLEVCVLPGTITVTARALEYAEQSEAAFPAGCVVTFSWHDGQRTKASKDAPWVDQGPGLGLGAFWSRQIPEEALWHAGNFRYAVLIRKEVVDSHPQKTIDLDEAGNVIFR